MYKNKPLAMDDEYWALIQAAFASTTHIPGDCGVEYRHPPFLTASGDLSHHLAALPPVWLRQAVPGHPELVEGLRQAQGERIGEPRQVQPIRRRPAFFTSRGNLG
jgi:hypothetical protein